MEQNKNLLDLTPDDWASMGLKTRLWNYIKLVEYIYYLEYKSVFKYEINDPTALNEIIQVIEEGRKGFILLGEVGCGKTFLVKMLQKITLPAKRFRIVNTVDVVTNFKADGEDSLSKYFGHKMFFDDLGFEQKGVHFGDKVDVIDYLSYKRYEEFSTTNEQEEGKIFKPTLTYFASNLSLSQIEERYDTRTIDRMKGMCKVIKLNGSSKRLSDVSGIILPQIFPIRYGMPKPNPPEFTMGPTKNGTLGSEVHKRMDEVFGVPDHENQRTVKIDKVITNEAK
jgi:energy-coupling factor transporter ATP-binding protein EcfA2